jgi:outer membrane protein insertion porin family
MKIADILSSIAYNLSRLLLVFAAILTCLLYAAQSFAEVDGKVIQGIEVRGLSRLSEEELINMMCFYPGNVFESRTLRKCIRRAFKKGIFLDIRVESEDTDDGLKLIYIINELPLIEDINITGNNRISGRRIRKVLGFEEGDDFRPELLDKAVEEVRNFYDRKGFPDADVKASFEKDEDASLVDITFDIDEGEPLIIKSIKMPPEALSRVGLYVGDIFDKEKVENELERLRRYYLKQGYYQPEIGPYELRDGELHVPVSPGSRLEVIFKENTVFSDKKLRKEMPFRENEMVSDELIEEASNRIRDLYLSKGYHYVQVAAGLESTDELKKVTFLIFEGEKVTTGKIKIAGTGIDHKVLKDMIPLHENEVYNRSLLESSKKSISDFYNALGYINMKFTDVREEFREDGRVVDVTFEIDEGQQVKIKEVRIAGNRDIGLSEIRNAVRIRKKAPFNVIDIGDARYRVLSLYKRYGYVDASVDVKSTVEGGWASLLFNIDEKKPSVLGKVIIRGDRQTKEKIIRREFTLREGAPYNYEELLKVKQRIYRLGIFDEVSIDVLAEDELPHKKVKDLLVTVHENKPGAVEVSLGYGDYEEFRGALDISYRNLGGYNRQIGLRGEVSLVETRYIVNFIEPWLFNKRDLPFRASLIKEERKNVNVDTRDVLYEIDKISFIASVEKELIPRLKAILGYEYSMIDTFNVEPGVVLTREDTGTLAISSISTSLFYDGRNNPFNPTRGSLSGIVLKFASKAFLSEVEFIKGTLQSSWFYELKKGLVLASSFRGGAAYSYEELEELPLVERFFLGGRTTVRGYMHDNLGPKGEDDVPTGGNIFALINEELRIDVGKGVGFVIFLDGGNIWRVTEDIDDELKFTVGGGLRYNTPVGPVRIDYGHKLDREAGESTGEIHFSFGHAF